MIPVSLSLAVLCILNIWTIEYAAGCGEQYEKDGRCCDQCAPGQYMKDFCKENQQTICSPCEEGTYSQQFNLFDRCEKCRSCQHKYNEKCTATTNTNCSCNYGFLCSNNVCSECEENKCVTGETLKRTDSSLDTWLITYRYQCEPSCADDTYFDAKDNLCKKDGDGIDFIHLILGIGFVLLSLTLLVFLSHTCMKSRRDHRAYNHPMEVLAVSTNASDFHLSKEESGRELIMQDESKNSNSIGLLHLEEVGTC
ncbi:LOW QUALITY PROTEIN: tumor necrosis factor receptor superfamily member 5-like [Cottoperca gobio]|uniref:LOW QUALITY PROTEIN: tumor necrosis factor receptor superfamily member 5-like n=1 Tax=Cottoperca gobio TaxID=56716 RepID=A0A6J2PS25_COTGO|nr:LOW QUALITY PROTEIN: tumor necrosis factor receptor superfamily member 5-like [Cottoperca gobio]